MMNPSRILVFRQSSLGDVVLTFPVVACLSETFPGCRIDFLTKTPFAEVVQNHPAVTTVFTFANNREFRSLAGKLKLEKYDLFIDLQNNLRSRLINLVARPKKTVRYPKRRLAREMVVRRSQLKLNVDHTVAAYFSALRKIGIDRNSAPSLMAVPPQAGEFAEKALASSGLSGRKLIAICPGAKHYEKRWPHSNFRDVALALLEWPDTGVIVIVSESDGVPARLEIDAPRLVEYRDESILNVAALLSRCRVALCNDSGLMHLANAVGVPVLAIFGPTNPRLGFAPILPGSRVICDDVFCSPCSVHGQKPCRQPRKYCFENITPERVLAELNTMMNSK